MRVMIALKPYDLGSVIDLQSLTSLALQKEACFCHIAPQTSWQQISLGTKMHQRWQICILCTMQVDGTHYVGYPGLLSNPDPIHSSRSRYRSTLHTPSTQTDRYFQHTRSAQGVTWYCYQKHVLRKWNRWCLEWKCHVTNAYWSNGSHYCRCYSNIDSVVWVVLKMWFDKHWFNGCYNRMS